jgi:hypothetical protein
MPLIDEFFVIGPPAALHYLVMIPVQLEYTAPTGCPTQVEFVALVANRGGTFAEPDANVRARRMLVSLRREASGHVGELELRADEAASDARELRGQSCAEVAEALAVVAAIALRGAKEEAGTIAPPPPGTTPSEPVAPPAQGAPSAAPLATPRETRLRAIGAWGNDQVAVSAGPLQVRRSLALTLTGGAVLGAIPGVVVPRYDLTFSRANYITTPQGSNYLIGGIVGVRWSFLGKATHRSGDFATRISGFKAGAHLCASLTYDTEGFVALFCSGFALGLVHLETEDRTSDYRQSKDIGIGAASIELNCSYNIGKYFHVNAVAGGEFWVGKLAAERADGSELFHSRLFNANLQLGVGVHF